MKKCSVLVPTRWGTGCFADGVRADTATSIWNMPLLDPATFIFTPWEKNTASMPSSSMPGACGYGQATGIDLPYENKGLVPSRQWKKERMGESWKDGDTVNVSIGQGHTLVTPLQTAVFLSALCNGGKLLKPQLLEDAPVEVRRADSRI